MGTVTKPGFYAGRFHQGGQGTEAETRTGETEAEAPDYDALPKAELLKLARDRGLDIADSATKAEIVAVLRAR